jgi:lysozyme family protein
MRRTRDLAYYEELWPTARVLFEHRNRVESARNLVAAHEAAYREVAAVTGVPWRLIGALHYREANCDFRLGIHNGEPWDRATTLVPAGRGPFATWHDAAHDALLQARMTGHTPEHWTLSRQLRAAEAYNGWGYAMREKPSPYVWNWTNHGVCAGYFVADGKYSETAENKQAGVVTLLIGLGVEQ